MARRFVKTPILDRLTKALRNELDRLTEEEMIQLDKECKKVTDFNCEWQRKHIADMYAYHVSVEVKNNKKKGR